MNRKLALTGIKPTGLPHLGNYFGAILPMVELVEKNEFDINVFVADYHALNAPSARASIKDNTASIVATYIACGLDPKKCIIYRQSRVLQTFALCSFLMNFTPKGLMNRGHAYKALVQENAARGIDTDDGINMGLYNYPILMAADILLFNAKKVPVGRDQRQHIEFARDIANSVNVVYPGLMEMPEGLYHEDRKEIIGIDGRKMSKSYNNYIDIFAEPDVVKSRVMRIKTDSKKPEDAKTEDGSIILSILSVLLKERDYVVYRDSFMSGGIGYGDAKKYICSVFNERFEAYREVYDRLMRDKSAIYSILEQGERAASERAQHKLEEIYEAVC